MLTKIIQLLLVITALLIALVALLGYIFQHEIWYHWVQREPGMAISTAAAFLCLSSDRLIELIKRVIRDAR